MDTQERQQDQGLTIDKETQINLVVNQPDDEDTIDMGRVFHHMKKNSRMYLLVLLLLAVAGVCAALVYYQLKKDPVTVYSAVTLSYEVDNEDETDPEAPKRIMVPDLRDPDGEDLDLSQITSSYVLQKALDSVDLSAPISMSDLRANINVEKLLTEESGRAQEVLSNMLENKSEDAYRQMQNMEYTYRNTFIVSLANGFGSEDSRTKINLRDDELSLLLERVLDSYNSYLVETYKELTLPDDQVSALNMEELDIPEGVDQLRSALNDLYTYCDEKDEEVKAYRSFETGKNLKDLMMDLDLIRSVDIEYLSAYVFSKGVAEDTASVIDNYRYRILMAETELKQINEETAAVRTLLNNYKNDKIFVASTENEEDAQTVQANTAYYNALLKQQVENEKTAAEKRQEIIEYESRIAALNDANSYISQAEIQEAQQELDRLYEKCEDITQDIRNHMTEVFATDFYNTLAEHSVAISDAQSFLKEASKKIIIGLVIGLLLGLALWFFSGLAPEMSRNVPKEGSDDQESEKPAKNDSYKGVADSKLADQRNREPADQQNRESAKNPSQKGTGYQQNRKRAKNPSQKRSADQQSRKPAKNVSHEGTTEQQAADQQSRKEDSRV